ncbi:hypothetical protein L195_g061057, partial [Trifolium pratense]
DFVCLVFSGGTMADVAATMQGHAAIELVLKINTQTETSSQCSVSNDDAEFQTAMQKFQSGAICKSM